MMYHILPPFILCLVLVIMLGIVWLRIRPLPDRATRVDFPKVFETLTFNLGEGETIQFDREDIRTLKRLATFYRDLHKVIPVHEP